MTVAEGDRQAVGSPPLSIGGSAKTVVAENPTSPTRFMSLYMMQRLRVHAILHGWVQGVGFRLFTQQCAQKLGLTGWVRNLPNGDVEVEAEGKEEALNELIVQLKTRHPWARIDHMNTDYYPCNGSFSSFDIQS